MIKELLLRLLARDSKLWPSLIAASTAIFSAAKLGTLPELIQLYSGEIQVFCFLITTIAGTFNASPAPSSTSSNQEFEWNRVLGMKK